MPSGRKLISINTPCYNEDDNVAECHEAIRRVFEERLPGYDYEHIFCDNASTDRTVPILREIAARDPRVKVVVNSRNFGLFASMFNGLMATRGDAVVALFPADLQDPPELIVDFVREWEAGSQVVLGIKKKREEGWAMRTVRKAYYRLVSSFANIHIPVDVSEFCLVDKVVVDALRGYDDYYPYIRGMIANCGFTVKGVDYTWLARKRGLTKHRFAMLIDQGLNGLISFTRLPMRICMFVGLAVSALSITWAFVSLFLNMFIYRSSLQPGIQSLIVAVFFFSGLQLLFFGVLGEYIAAIHFQVRKRPLVIERERINFTPAEPSPAPALSSLPPAP
jgi:glycosyltransferase involved in cell wall biosynthesis